MAKHILQLRRGTRYVDDNGVTLLNPYGTPVRDDWTTYTAQEYHMDPLAGELVLEYEVNPTTGKSLPRLKIGDGVNTFAQLEYMSVDSFILPKPISVTLYADKWEQMLDAEDNTVEDAYYQVVTVDNAVITENSKVDLQPSVTDLSSLVDLGIALTTGNTGGVITVYSVGGMPERDYTIQAVVTEVLDDE